MKTPHVSLPRPEDENLGVGANMAYGLQHVLTMYGGIVAVPLIIGQAAGLSPADIGLLIAASLFAGGLATLLQTLGLPFFGCQLPLVQGVSFSGVATMVAIVGSGPSGLAEVWRCETVDGRLTRVRDYFFCPEVVSEIAAAWSAPTVLHGYRYA